MRWWKNITIAEIVIMICILIGIFYIKSIAYSISMCCLWMGAFGVSMYFAKMEYNSITRTYLRLDSFISILVLLLNSILLVILILNLYIS